MSKRQGELAQVLFMDLVRYSQRPLDEQKALVKALVKIVENVRKKYRLATGANRHTCLPTGDGMALIFRGNDYEAPLKCAWAVTEAIAVHNRRRRRSLRIQLRMGIHSGRAGWLTRGKPKWDTAKLFAYGPAINMAQRIMDCGDASHILCSQSYYELVGTGEHHRLFHSAGRYPVKGDIAQLYNLHGALEAVDKSRKHRKMRAGRSERPKRRAFVNVPSLKKHYPTNSALALFLYRQLEKGLEAVLKAGEGIPPARVWEVVYPILDKHAGLKGWNVALELVSVMNPDEWGRDLKWNGYYGRVARISGEGFREARSVDVRRIHVLCSTTLEDRNQLAKLCALMVCEFIDNIRCRAIFVPADETIVDRGTRACAFMNFSLFDYGIYRTGSNMDIIFSNIVPYFKDRRNEQRWGIATFGTGEDPIYHSLRGNFYRAWFTIPDEYRYSLPRLITEAKFDKKETDLILDMIMHHLPIPTGSQISDQDTRTVMAEIRKLCRVSAAIGEEHEEQLLSVLRRIPGKG